MTHSRRPWTLSAVVDSAVAMGLVVLPDPTISEPRVDWRVLRVPAHLLPAEMASEILAVTHRWEKIYTDVQKELDSEGRKN